MLFSITLLHLITFAVSAMSSTPPAAPSSTPSSTTCADYGAVPCGNSCMPPSASCCSMGGYCPAGEYCTSGGCCPDGEVCVGYAGTTTVPPTSYAPTPTKNAAADFQYGFMGHGVALAAGLLAI